MGYVSLQAPPSLFLGQPGFAEGFLSNSFPPKPEATEVPEVLRVKKNKSLVPESVRPVSPVLKSFANPLPHHNTCLVYTVYVSLRELSFTLDTCFMTFS